MRILLVDDDPHVVRFVGRLLHKAGYEFDAVTDGHSAIDAATQHSYATVLLDVGLPDIDGFDVARRLRDAGCWVPILMLTARGEVDDRVAGLDSGADDYLGKPFENAELLARLRSLTRRNPSPRPPVLTVADLCLDPAARTVRRGQTDIELTAKEFALLEFLMRRAGSVVTRADLLDSIWGYRYGSKVVDVYISYLRDKIDKPFGISSIRSVRGVGYEFVDHSTESATV